MDIKNDDLIKTYDCSAILYIKLMEVFLRRTELILVSNLRPEFCLRSIEAVPIHNCFL